VTWEVVSGPSDEPITLSEAKAWLKVDDSAEDALIESLISAARRKAEQYAGQLLLTQTVREYFDGFPPYQIELSFPANSITSVKYKDETGTEQTVSSADYSADIVSKAPRIWINPDKAWPTTGSYPNAVSIEYSTGYATASNVPDTFKTAICLLLAFLYENREDMPISGSNDPRVRSFNLILHNEKTMT